MPDERFEQVLGALLDGTRLPPLGSSTATPGVEQLLLLCEVARAHRHMMVDDGDGSPESGSGWRWGHLEVREALGRGASATVYRAWDPRLGREVALKLFDTDAIGCGEALREGQRLARLRHPHLVTVFGADTCDGTSGVWMEFVPGETVDAIVSRTGPWTVEATLVTMRDLASALASIHDSNLLHRDVKARNVIREPGGRVVLMDLGAGQERGLPDSGVAGTPLYMAPELFTGSQASERTDVYSLGVLMYFMLSGAYPVDAGSIEELLGAHGSRRSCRLAVARPALPAAVTALADRFCAADPGERPATAREAEAELAACLAHVVADRHRVPAPMERLWARLVRPLAVTAGMALLAASLLLTFWDADVIRDARWAIAPQLPSSRLFVTSQSAIGGIDKGRVELLATNPVSAVLLAVSSHDATMVTMAAAPPFEQGGQVVPAAGGPGRAIAASWSICCFGDGTTDGRFNYAIRRDETRSPGSRPLAAATLYRFSREWTDPHPLFELDPLPVYCGVAYDPEDDTFVMTHNVEREPNWRLERWSRVGKRLAVLVEGRDAVNGVAFDPADRTIWVLQERQMGAGYRLLAFRRDGRLLGALDLAGGQEYALDTLSGAEFPLPDAEPWAARSARRLSRWLGW